MIATVWFVETTLSLGACNIGERRLRMAFEPVSQLLFLGGQCIVVTAAHWHDIALRLKWGLGLACVW
ncbi:hypothetical protein GCM10007932_47290 [Vibrio penaeicida]|uniref:DUF645 family protein n=1 Tax=Vibrio penaeicida TaxID=104609 RepID=A0AAV5NXR5_9VIBR|nr:hypothetical protein GCM10007932_47290 [Vibrio penaeicida]